MTMISVKKLIKMAMRWQKLATIQRKRISFSRNGSDADSCNTSSSSIVEKGHFVVYTIDQRRYAFSLSEEEFGVPSCGPTTRDSVFMDYIISLIKKAWLQEIFTKHCSSQFLHVAARLTLHQESGSQKLLVG